MATIPDRHVLVFGLREARALQRMQVSWEERWFRCCHAVVGSPFKNLTFMDSGRQWEPIGMDGRIDYERGWPRSGSNLTCDFIVAGTLKSINQCECIMHHWVCSY